MYISSRVPTKKYNGVFSTPSGVGVHCAVATLRRPAEKGGGWMDGVITGPHPAFAAGATVVRRAVSVSSHQPFAARLTRQRFCVSTGPCRRGGAHQQGGGVDRGGHVRSSPRVCPRRHDCRTRGRRPAITFLDVSQPYIGATCPMGRVGVSAPSRKGGGGWMGSLPVHTLRLQPAPRL